MSKFIRKNGVLLAIILLGLFLRLYKAYDLFAYAHDQDLAAWIVRDIITDKPLRLIGQETSTQGIFIGSLYYYLQVPFYLLFRGQPHSLIILATFLGMFTVFSCYFVFTKIFKDKRAGLIGGFIYAVSFFTVMNDRGTVPTTPVLLWTLWYLYGLFLVSEGKYKKGMLSIGALAALIWHLNFGLAVLLILIPTAFYISGKKPNYKEFLPGFFIFNLISLPLYLFEIKHNFIQLNSLFGSFLHDQGSRLSVPQQFVKVFNILLMLISNIVWYPNSKLFFLLPLILIIVLIYLLKNKDNPKIIYIMLFWSIPSVLFFSLYSKIVSEYYLNSVVIAWIGVMTYVLLMALKNKKTVFIAYLFLLLFAFVNINKMLSYEGGKDGYVNRRALVSEIKSDARKHDFPCVSVSYITNPGYNLGYRYLFVMESLHVNDPRSLSPVYTIVFPLNDELFPVNKTYGNIGLIYPDYSRYNTEEVRESCSGENSNLTDPMFGFTD